MDIELTDEYNTCYFHYISPAKGCIFSYEYFNLSLSIKDPAMIAYYLIANTVNDLGDPRCYCNDMTSLHRRRKGYLIIAVEGHQYYQDDPVDFTLLKWGSETSAASQINAPVPKDTTFKFYSNNNIDFNGLSIGVMTYVNNMSNRLGDPLEEKEWEEFDISIPNLGWASSLKDLTGGTGGTNMGGPVPPPKLFQL